MVSFELTWGVLKTSSGRKGPFGVPMTLVVCSASIAFPSIWTLLQLVALSTHGTVCSAVRADSTPRCHVTETNMENAASKKRLHLLYTVNTVKPALKRPK